MQCKTLHKSTRNTLVAKSLALSFAIFLTTSAYTTAQSQPPPVLGGGAVVIQEGAPGGAIIETFEMTAKVTGVDTTNRNLRFEGADGTDSTIKVGPEAVNFDQIQVGDLITARVTKELIVHLVDEHATIIDGKATTSLGYIETGNLENAPDGASGIVAHAAKGSQPGGLIGSTVQVTATVTEIDEAKHTATLRLEDGTTKTLPVRDDVDLSQRKVGEKVVFHLTEVIAISIDKQ